MEPVTAPPTKPLPSVVSFALSQRPVRALRGGIADAGSERGKRQNDEPVRKETAQQDLRRVRGRRAPTEENFGAVEPDRAGNWRDHRGGTVLADWNRRRRSCRPGSGPLLRRSGHRLRI